METSGHMQLDKNHIPENLLLLRRRLKLSQKEFIRRFLMDDHDAPLISIATLSNIENGSVSNLDNLVEEMASNMGVGSDLFYMNPDAFAKNLDDMFAPLLTESPTLEIFAPVRTTSAVETLVRVISDYLTDSIISGKLKPGDKLPSDRNLAAQFGVGRTAIRESLKVLSVLGLIYILPSQGTFVASQSSDFFLAPLSWTFLLGEQNTDHIIDVRNVLEIESARLAAKNPEAKQSLQGIYQQMSTAFGNNDFKGFLDLDLDFHLGIAQCSDNPIICNLLATSRKLLSYISKSGMSTISHLESIFNEHTRIYEAIAGRDSAEASQAMKDHLKAARARYQV